MPSKNIHLYIVMILAMISWGASWPAAKIVGQYANPQDLIVWRFAFALVAMLIIMKIFNIPLTFPVKSLKFVVSASMLILIYNYNYLKGTQVGQSGLGGVIVPTLSPILTFVFSVLFLKNKLQSKESIGLVVGLIGAVLLVRAWEMNANTVISSGNIYFLLGATVWAGATIFTQKASFELHPINFSFWVYGIAMLLALPVFPIDALTAIFSYDWIFWINFILISMIALGLGTTAYFITTMRLGSGKASSFMFIVPFSAVISSSIFLGEVITLTTVIGGFFAIMAVYIINK